MTEPTEVKVEGGIETVFFSYTKSDLDCEYIVLNPLIFKSVYMRHNVSSDVIVGAFGREDFGVILILYYRKFKGWFSTNSESRTLQNLKVKCDLY